MTIDDILDKALMWIGLSYTPLRATCLRSYSPWTHVNNPPTWRVVVAPLHGGGGELRGQTGVRHRGGDTPAKRPPSWKHHGDFI